MRTRGVNFRWEERRTTLALRTQRLIHQKDLIFKFNVTKGGFIGRELIKRLTSRYIKKFTESGNR